MIRFVRIPYYYLTDGQIILAHRYSHFLLKIIRDIHLDIPNQIHWNRAARYYQYYPSFPIWVHDKTVDEMAVRGINHKSPLDDNIRSLGSRSLSYFLPPNDTEIAEDVVYVMDCWKNSSLKGGRKIPLSYLELARNIYGYSPNERALERTEQISGSHYNHDSGWYYVQSET